MPLQRLLSSLSKFDSQEDPIANTVRRLASLEEVTDFCIQDLMDLQNIALNNPDAGRNNTPSYLNLHAATSTVSVAKAVYIPSSDFVFI